MDSLAIQQCLKRLEKAKSALQQLELAKNLQETESAWSDLLLAGNAVFSKIDQGSKGNGKASGWFGRVKKARKDDPLLSYMHHARNSEEHSIEDITKRMGPGQATFTFREPFDPKKLEGVQIKIDATTQPGKVKVWSSNEDVIKSKSYDEPEIALVRVSDPRYSDYFDPPFEHLGVALADQSPSAVGRLFVAYIAQLIEDARTFGCQ